MRFRTSCHGVVAALCVVLAGAGGASADDASIAASARAVGALCNSGTPPLAAVALRSLLGSIHDEGHRPVAEVVRRYLACLDPAAETAQVQYRSAGANAADTRKALRALRPCGKFCLQATTSHDCPDGDFESSLTLAAQSAQSGVLADLSRAATLAECARKGARTSDEIIRVNETIAKIALQLSDNRRALRAAQDAAGAARVLEQESGRSPLRLRIEMARLLGLVGDLVSAGAELEQLDSLVTEPRVRARLLAAHGEFQLLLGSPSRALEYLTDALKEHERLFGPDHVSTAGVQHLLGDAHRSRRDYAAALAAYQRALEIRRAAFGPDHPETAATENAIGVVHMDFKDWPRATQAFASVTANLERALGPNHPRTLAARLNASLAAWKSSGSAAAASRYRSTVASLETALGADHPQVATARRSLAKIELALGRPGVANEILQQALASQRRQLGERHPATIVTLLEQGQLLARTGGLADSAAKLCSGIAMLDQSFGREHPLTARYRMLLSRVTVARGGGPACPGHQTSAWDEAREAGRAISLHLQRSFGAMSESQRQSFARDSLQVVGALLSVPGAPPSETYLATFPHRDSVLRSIAASRANQSDDSAAKRIRDALQEKRRRYSAALLLGTEESAKHVAEWGQEIDKLTRISRRAFRFAPADPTQVLARACEKLPQDAAVIEFVDYDRNTKGRDVATTPHLAAFVIRGGDCRVTRVDLGASAPISDAAERLNRAMRSIEVVASAAPPSERGISLIPSSERMDERLEWTELSRLLLAPLREATRGTHRWLVIPDSRLWGVPFGALRDPERKDGYLMDRLVIGYLSSIYELADAAPSRRPLFSSPLLFGGPRFGDADTGPRVLTNAGPCTLLPFDPLPGTVAELQSLREVLGPATPMIIGADATKERFEAMLRNRPSLVHLATHGYFAGNAGCSTEEQSDDSISDGTVGANPLLLSGIAFAGANHEASMEQQSGILTAYEVAGLDLRETPLVVLSACDSGTGLQERAQEVQGMRWGFRAAGANALVVSLWPADDLATPELMKNFYAALKQHESPNDVFRGAEAMSQAQRKFAVERRDRPDLWANFVFSGIL